MSKDLQQSKTTFSLTPSSLEEAMKLADIMAKSDMVPKDFQGKPGNVLVAVQMGAEVGLQPMQAIQNIAVINGRPSIWGDAVPAIIKTHPKYEYMKEWYEDDKKEAHCVLKRKGEDEHHVVFSWADAVLAGLIEKTGSLYKKYPKRMLQMRARSWAARDVFPDALKGLSIAEEAMDMEPLNGNASVVMEEENNTLGAAGVADRIRNKPANKAEPEQKQAAKQEAKPQAEVVDAEYTEVPKQEQAKPETKQEPKPEPGTAVADPIGPNKVAVIKGMLAKNDKTPEWLFKQLNINGYGQINNADMNKVLSTISGSK